MSLVVGVLHAPNTFLIVLKWFKYTIKNNTK